MKRIAIIMLCMLCFVQPVSAQTKQSENPELKITAPSAVLMEVSTGQILYETGADEKRPPASVTKIMTLLLIFDALEEEKLQLEDEVVTSEYAASMGGSQVYLEPGEKQTVETLIKCIAVASANDACVAMAEQVCGSEDAFVEQMNQKAKELGMEQTHFVNCNGLDIEGHLTTAKDIAIMSRELIRKYPQIRTYCTIWQEDIVHKTKKGETNFGLTNTNKLLKSYPYATGLKTGFTSTAKSCISATAEKDGLELIAVIMAADDSKKRNADAVTLLNYGFASCQKYEHQTEKIPDVKVKGGRKEMVGVEQKSPFCYVETNGKDLSQIITQLEWKGNLEAPVEKGACVGEVVYLLEDKEIGRAEVVTTEGVGRLTYGIALRNMVESLLGI